MLDFHGPSRLLVDINGIAELGELSEQSGELRIGALTRQLSIERSEVVGRRWPLLAQAVAMVGHTATRSRGTVGGSAAYADPCAELPAALVALDARFRLVSARGEREVRAGDFFRGSYRTALAVDELLSEIVVPAPAGRCPDRVRGASTHARGLRRRRGRGVDCAGQVRGNCVAGSRTAPWPSRPNRR